MATLEMDLNCMCLLVPDPSPGGNRGAVHVLMPNTHDHGPDDRHVAPRR